MEFTLFTVSLVGWRALWMRNGKRGAHSHSHNGRVEARFAYVVLALFLTAAAFLAWWSTGLLYDQQVIYSYKALARDST
jgi:hypothetical protein